MQTEITFPAPGATLPGVLAVPDGRTAPGPALLLVYEAFGMTGEMRRVAADLAGEGYAVLVPDLFARGPKALCVASALRTARRGAGRELDDLEAARRWLADRPEVDADRIGVIGFCLGGGFALLLARTGLYRVSAPFYPGVRVGLPRSCPVVASLGGRDPANRGYDARLERDLDALGVPHDVTTYPDAGHSFYTRADGGLPALLERSPLPVGYDAASAADARRRILAFFGEHL